MLLRTTRWSTQGEPNASVISTDQLPAPDIRRWRLVATSIMGFFILSTDGPLGIYIYNHSDSRLGFIPAKCGSARLSWSNIPRRAFCWVGVWAGSNTGWSILMMSPLQLEKTRVGPEYFRGSVHLSSAVSMMLCFRRQEVESKGGLLVSKPNSWVSALCLGVIPGS